jgi:DNA polymerase I-like protein with 3'-5' exonuclease and polymerase domains
MTYELFKYQEELFALPENASIFKIFRDVEMAVMPATAEMELTGLEIDKDYIAKLGKKYHEKLDEIDKRILLELESHTDTIKKWRQTPKANVRPRTYLFNTKHGESEEAKKLKPGEVLKGYPLNDNDGKGPYKAGKSPNELLEDPINLGSPAQLAILLYDIMKVEPPNPKKPRGTGKEELEAIKLPICKLLLERRGLAKLIDAFIDSLPNEIIEKTGRVHANFNQYGADTGRYSCSNPNMQQIPAKNKEIRLIFKASDGNMLVGSDYSQQEPRLLSQLSHDEALINAYKEGKDLYAIIATKVYKNTYWDNMEHWEDGTSNPEGKKRRKKCKTLLLAIMYGMGMATIADMLGCEYDEAKQLVEDFYAGFPAVKAWMDKAQQFCRDTGYVEDLWGRRRRLPDINKPKFEVLDKNGAKKSFNPLFGSKGITRDTNTARVNYYMNALTKAKTKRDFNGIKSDAEKEGFIVQEWTGSIAKAERQCINAAVQGGAATLTKMAMVKIHSDEVLKNLGFRLAIAVHDELIGECPKENAQAAADRLCKLMIEAAAADIEAPFKCDPTIEESWAESDYKDMLFSEYEDFIDEKMPIEEALANVRKEHPEASNELFAEIFAKELEVVSRVAV